MATIVKRCLLASKSLSSIQNIHPHRSGIKIVSLKYKAPFLPNIVKSFYN